jgi:hypothetical protein
MDLKSRKELGLGVLAMLLSCLAAGFALCMNIVHYRTWYFVPPAAFPRFQDASAIHTVPAAAILGLTSLILATLVARKGLPGVSRVPLWVAVALAMLPWVVTPLLFIPLQGRLSAAGPVEGLVWELVWNDLLLRAAPPLMQAMIHYWAVQRSLKAIVSEGAA